ncbi:integrase [Mycolicibacterium moriokaense]|uniref:Prophage phiRv2 integrase n=1 Tax=Mycolicibacterium moriokaense TaxID=39691 RepID=A0AAD1HAQ5_9MYCO|nr:site-specific integrase [Mycolicibacterium moriokaense]MCV7039681.1 site-specific integrase [Mycolicibacterium moriokaense]ORB19871.1 integrase [Mycolicibacterium moriokaense]BBX01870.1 putative prophage phiRv2 integrase [Mycolicibacterium moriokaense]
MAGKRGRRGWGFIRRLPSGRYQASYVGPDLVRHRAPRTYERKTDAEKWLADERWSVEREQWTPPAQREAEKRARGVTLAEYGPTWIESRTKGGRPLKPRTTSHYRHLFNEHIKDSLGKLALRDITPAAVRDWHGRTLVGKPTMRAHCYGLLHSMLASAVADELIPVNPATIKGAAKAARKREPVILDVAEVSALADAIEPERFKAWVLLAAWCGPRWGESTELRRRDVARDCSEITITRAVIHRDKACVIDTPKSGEGRKVVVPPHVRPVLKRHLKDHVDDDPDALLFPPARGGCHLRDKVFRETYFDPALAKIGRDGKDKPRPTIHDLRHFAGTATARVGNLVETMGRLGHKTVEASLIYQSIADGRDAEVADALSKLAEI